MTGVPEWIEKNPRWPLAPLCGCGAGPGMSWRACHLTPPSPGRQAAGVNVEDCPRWQAIALACRWWVEPE